MRHHHLLALGMLLAGSPACTEGSALYDFDGDDSPDTEDCAPEDASIYPGAPDLLGDGIDQDCDGVDGDAEDLDGDGFLNTNDCGPEDPEVYPGALDPHGDGVDQNCDGGDGIDQDGDGYPANDDLDDPDLYDCDDNNPAVNPGEQELPGNGIDEDCDGYDELDADGDGSPDSSDCAPEDPLLNHQDADADGYSTCDGDCDDQDALLSPQDSDGDGVTLCGGDCDDASSSNFPGNAEVCDGSDNDCDGEASPGEADIDLDGYAICQGDCDDLDPALTPGVDSDADGYSACEDCDDGNPDQFPGHVEVCDGLDNDCDGTIGAGEVDIDLDGYSLCEGDCDDLSVLLTPADLDGDGYSLCDLTPDCDDADSLLTPADADFDGFSSCTGDCDDASPVAYPGALELCDGLDNDCDGTVPADESDGDGDLFAVCAGDCDDLNTLLTPADLDGDGYSTCSDDCDDADALLTPADSDSDGFSTCTGDCDESEPGVYPAAVELCDGLDNDCDGTVPTDESDGDGDGYALCDDCDDTDASLFGLDDDSDGFTLCTGDCNESNPAIYPGAVDNPNDMVDQNCDGVDGSDLDGDGYAGDILATSPVWDCNDWNATLNLDDADGDGWDTCSGDCDDSDPAMNLDDTDGDGWDTCSVDCDDGNPAIFPGWSSAWDNPTDGVDEDCDGTDATGLAFATTSFAGSGYVVSSAGDVDGDGLDDVLLGGLGNEAHLFLGGTLGSGGSFDTSLADAVFVGENWNDNSGRAVSSAGDVDGDGLDDLLIGATGNDDGGTGAGKTYLILGSTAASGGSFNLSQADASFVGENANDSSGWVSSAGDVDGDGLDDLLIGANGNDDGGGGAGKTYLFFGSTVALGGSFDLSLADAAFVGENGGDNSGARLSTAGDVDGDGLDDLLIGANGNDDGGNGAGKTYLFFGSTVALGGSFDLSQADAAFVGENSGDASGGNPVSSAGDVDGDGLGDLLIGAATFDVGLNSDAGKTYLIFGSAVASGTTYDLSLAGAAFVGEASGDRSGTSVSSAGDVDGDGLDDLLIGASDNGGGGSMAGKTYVIFGSTVASGGTFSLSLADAAFVGENVNDRSGRSVSSAGDVDGDGLDDLLIGGLFWGAYLLLSPY